MNIWAPNFGNKYLHLLGNLMMIFGVVALISGWRARATTPQVAARK